MPSIRLSALSMNTNVKIVPVARSNHTTAVLKAKANSHDAYCMNSRNKLKRENRSDELNRSNELQPLQPKSVR